MGGLWARWSVAAEAPACSAGRHALRPAKPPLSNIQPISCEFIEQAVDLRTQRAEAIAAAKSAVAQAITARDQECGKVGENCRKRIAELNARQSELTADVGAPTVASASVSAALPKSWAGLVSPRQRCRRRADCHANRRA